MLGMWKKGPPETRLLEGWKKQVKRYAEPEPLPTSLKLIANEQPCEDTMLRGSSLIELCAIVPGAEKILNR